MRARDCAFFASGFIAAAVLVALVSRSVENPDEGGLFPCVLSDTEIVIEPAYGMADVPPTVRHMAFEGRNGG